MLRWLESGELQDYQPGPLPEHPERHRIAQARELMSVPPITVPIRTTVGQALELMRGRGVSHLPVLEDDKMVGLVSDRDLLSVGDPGVWLDRVMTTEVMTAAPEAPISTVARWLVRAAVHCVPVVDQDRQVVGMLTSLDILGALAHHAPMEVWL